MDDLKPGLSYIGQDGEIKDLVLFFAFVFFLVAPVAFLTPLLVTRSYGDEVWRLTANEVTFFAGSIVGGFIMTAWGGFKNHFRTIGLSCLLWAVLSARSSSQKVIRWEPVSSWLSSLARTGRRSRLPRIKPP